MRVNVDMSASAPHISEGRLYLQVRGVHERALITHLKQSLLRGHYRQLLFTSQTGFMK